MELKTLKDDGIFGYCSQESRREFKIDLSAKMDIRDTVITAIHEMIHVKQYVRGELQDISGRTRWKSKTFGDLSYSNQPWEREANRLDVKLTKQFFADCEKK